MSKGLQPSPTDRDGIETRSRTKTAMSELETRKRDRLLCALQGEDGWNTGPQIPAKFDINFKIRMRIWFWQVVVYCLP